MNLKELLKDKQLPVKVKLQGWNNDDYFEVVSFNEFGTIGYSKDGFPRSHSFFSKGWELYQEPKKKIVLSEYLVERVSCGFDIYFFKSDEEFLKEFPRYPIIKTCRTIEVELP